MSLIVSKRVLPRENVPVTYSGSILLPKNPIWTSQIRRRHTLLIPYHMVFLLRLLEKHREWIIAHLRSKIMLPVSLALRTVFVVVKKKQRNKQKKTLYDNLHYDLRGK